MSFNASLMNKATTSDPAPTAGYLFEEIAKMTHMSFDVNAKVVSFVQTRLQNKSSHVKWKTLLMVKYVASKGAPGFKQAMQRQLMGDLKQCLSFTGPQDVLRQDEYNARVRTAAAGALEAVTADDRATGGRMAGLGSDSFSSNTNPNNNPGGGVGGGSGSSGNAGGPVVPFSNNNSGTAGYANNSGRMQGIGSGPWDPNAKKETFGSSALSAARSAASKLVYAAGTPEQRNMAYGGGGSGGGDFSNSYASNRGSNAYGQASWQPTPGYSGNGSSSSGGGGGSNGGGGAAAVNWGSGGGSSNAAPAAASSSLSASSVGGHGGMGGGADDGAYERGLVAELCVPGGARAVPPSDALAKFLELAPSLDSELVGPCLLETFSMPDVPWQARSKALAVGLALVKSNNGSSNASSSHVEWFQANAVDDLKAMANDATMKPASLATKARDLLVALGLSTGASSSAGGGGGSHGAVSAVSTSQGAAAAPGGEMDLLGTFDEPPPPPQVAATHNPPPPLTPTAAPLSQPVAATPSPVKAAGGGSLFGSLAVKPSPTAAPSPSPMPNTAPSEASLLSALSLNDNGSSSGGSTVNATAAAPVSAPPVAAPAAPVHDPFGLSDLSTAPSVSTSAPPPVPPPSASSEQETGFDFMGGGGQQQQREERPMPDASSLMPSNQPPVPQQMPVYGQQQQQPMGVGGGGMGYNPQGGMGYQPQQQPPMGMDAAALYQQNMYLMQQMQQNQMMMQQQQMQQPMHQPMQSSMMPPQGSNMMMPPPMQQQGCGNGSSAFDFMGNDSGLGGFNTSGPGGNSSGGRAGGAPQKDAFSFVKDSMQAK